jgi:hypothetical protein
MASDWREDWYNQIASGKKTKQQLFADFPSYVDRYQEWERVQNYNQAQADAERQKSAEAAAAEAQKVKAAEIAQVALKAKNAADQDQASLMLKRKKGGPKRNIMTSPLGLSNTANMVRQTLGGM